MTVFSRLTRPLAEIPAPRSGTPSITLFKLAVIVVLVIVHAPRVEVAIPPPTAENPLATLSAIVVLITSMVAAPPGRGRGPSPTSARPPPEAALALTRFRKIEEPAILTLPPAVASRVGFPLFFFSRRGGKCGLICGL